MHFHLCSQCRVVITVDEGRTCPHHNDHEAGLCEECAQAQPGFMSAEASVLVFEGDDPDTCVAMVRQFFCENQLARTVKVALSTPDLKPFGVRVWRIVDGNIEVISRIIAGFIMTQPHRSVTISATAD